MLCVYIFVYMYVYAYDGKKDFSQSFIYDMHEYVRITM